MSYNKSSQVSLYDGATVVTACLSFGDVFAVFWSKSSKIGLCEAKERNILNRFVWGS